MQSESLEVLEKADVPAKQARAIVRAIGIELAGAKDSLATKHDLLLLRQDLQQEIHQTESTLRMEMSEMRTALRSEMAKLGADLRAETSKLGGVLRAEFHAGLSNNTKQMYVAMLGQMAVLLGIAYFFVSNVQPWPPRRRAAGPGRKRSRRTPAVPSPAPLAADIDERSRRQLVLG